MKKISIVTPCYNEEENVVELHSQISAVMESLPQYEYEHIYIDNASKDNTPALLRQLAEEHAQVRVILNNRNFGHIRSPHYGLLQAQGDAVIVMVSDLQDPPALIADFLAKWEEGYEVVVGQKLESDESRVFHWARGMYYKIVNNLAEIELLEHVTGFGLYDRKVVEIFRQTDDVYPYGRGLISEFGFRTGRIPYRQAKRVRGISKNNFYTLYDMAMLGITTHSKVPLRLATMLGFGMSFLSFFSGLVYLIYKIVFWNSFNAGIAPLVIGLFFISSIQLFFLGIVGEYIGFMHSQILHRPLVVERERIGWDVGDSTPTAKTN